MSANDKISLWHAWGYTAILSCGGILYGIDQGGLSGFLAMPEYQKQFGTYDEKTHKYAVTANWQLALNFVTLAGAILAALLSGEITSRVGRRGGMFTFCISGVLGAAIQLGATTINTILGGKFFIGWAFGSGTMVISLYVSETAPKAYRGPMMSLLLLTISLGSMIGSGVNWISHDLKTAWAYRAPFVAELILPVIMLFAIWIVPESPRWLALKGRPEDAARSIQRLRGPAYPESAVQEEVRLIQEAIEEERTLQHSASWARLFSREYRRRTTVAVLVMVANQYSGIGFVSSYGTYFFSISGIKDPFVVGFLLYILAAAGCLFCIIASGYLGRRTMMIGGGIIQCLSMFIFAIVGVTNPGTQAAAKTLVAFVLLYEFATHASWGPLCYVIGAEVSSAEMRAKTVALAVGVNWAGTFSVAGWLPYALNPSYGDLGAKLGFIFGPCILLSTIWMYFYLPETLGRSLEEINELMTSRVPARKSAAYKFTQGALPAESSDTEKADDMQLEN